MARQRASLQQIAQRVALTYRGDCVAYGLLASGHLNLLVEAVLAPHDVLPRVPIVLAAGGVISDWTGRALLLTSPGHVIAAATPALHAQAIGALAQLLPWVIERRLRGLNFADI